ncbi:protein DEHYDRATION-INDUCED 19 homolog 2 [Cajanus cajan]|uniref:protein DEHYDRATION-INDUCED 19 homolog 2 n=1 Tax=Cajanus cajan TaxID=3821 RepID=UPI00098D875A|nr:protein DEHYDRATION-INDUCED 19 homolog 2 [Cajanus cajan]
MEDETLSFGLSTASRGYQSRLKSHFELFIDFDEVTGDDELRTAYTCPFCAEDFDLLEPCCHIDLDHPSDAKSGICPVCTMWVGTNIVDHIAAQHGNMFKSQLKSKCYKHESYPAPSFSRKCERDGHWKSFSAELSPVMSTSKAARDPWLSFLCGASAVEEREHLQPDSSSEVSTEEIHSNDKALERDVQPTLSDKDQIEKAQRSKFVQGLLMSTILDPDF